MLVNHLKNQEPTKQIKETGDSRYIYQNELDKVGFEHDMAYGDFKDLTRRTDSYKRLRGKACWISTWTCFNGVYMF